jgi:hypothetical protein
LGESACNEINESHCIEWELGYGLIEVGPVHTVMYALLF